MIPSKLYHFYVSEVDKFLMQLQKTFPLSESQQQEIAEQRRIIRLRDDSTPSEPQILFDDHA